MKSWLRWALLDISMPGMTGIDIIRECAALNLNTQFIFISGFQDFEYAKSAIKYGAVDYLLKPIILEELMNAIEKCIVNITGIKREPEQLFLEHREEFTRLIEVEGTCYVPVLTDIVYTGNMNDQMKKLVQFSFYSFIEEYIDRISVGITFKRAGRMVIILKGMERSQCIEILWALQHELEDSIRQKAVFVVGQLTKLTLNVLADEIHMNPYYFSTFFKKNAGINFKDYVCRIRLEHAVPLLVSSDKKTYEIAVEVGFTDARTFAEAFQRHFHETPNAYRKRIKE